MNLMKKMGKKVYGADAYAQKDSHLINLSKFVYVKVRVPGFQCPGPWCFSGKSLVYIVLVRLCNPLSYEIWRTFAPMGSRDAS